MDYLGMKAIKSIDDVKNGNLIMWMHTATMIIFGFNLKTSSP
jgi:hypothetical protein